MVPRINQKNKISSGLCVFSSNDGHDGGNAVLSWRLRGAGVPALLPPAALPRAPLAPAAARRPQVDVSHQQPASQARRRE